MTPISSLHKMNELLSLYRAEDSHASSGAQVEAANYKHVILSEDLQNPYLYWRRSILLPHEHHSTKNPVSEATLKMSTSDNVCLFWILLSEKHQTILICWNNFRGNKYSIMQNNFSVFTVDWNQILTFMKYISLQTIVLETYIPYSILWITKAESFIMKYCLQKFRNKFSNDFTELSQATISWSNDFKGKLQFCYSFWFPVFERNILHVFFTTFLIIFPGTYVYYRYP